MFNSKEVTIIAEIGNNHEGDISFAKECIHAAVEAGADAVKFQAIRPDLLVNLKLNENRFNTLMKICLPIDDFNELFNETKKLKCKFGVSFFDSETLLELPEFDFAKIASSELNNYSLINQVSNKYHTIVMSTGASTSEEIQKAMDSVVPGKNVTLCHCVSNYPTSFKDANLNILNHLKKFENVILGYSDHSTEISISVAAIALGARVIEKHFTLDKTMTGVKDHQLSADFDELKKYIFELKQTYIALGNSDPNNRSLKEMENRDEIRRGVYINKSKKAGEIIEAKDLIALRPYNGFSPETFDDLVGSYIAEDLQPLDSIKIKKNYDL